MEDRGTSFLSTVVFNRVQSRNPRAGVDVSPTAAAPCPPGNISSRTFGVPRCFPGWDNAGGKLQSCSVPVSPHRIPIPAFHRACQGSAKRNHSATFSAFNHCQMFFEQNMNFSPENRTFCCNKPPSPPVL